MHSNVLFCFVDYALFVNQAQLLFSSFLLAQMNSFQVLFRKDIEEKQVNTGVLVEEDTEQSRSIQTQDDGFWEVKKTCLSSAGV